MQNNNIQQNNRIREFKLRLRNKIKANFKFSNIKQKLEITQIQQIQSKKNIELDKRNFLNVFQLQEKLGEGSSGIVRKCKEIKTGNIYAVKITTGDQELIRIYKKTYHILKMFDHDTIIKAKYLFIDQTTQNIFLVMQYCSFYSLTNYMIYISYQQIKNIIKMLLETVNILHKNGVCHRDLKPDNILYDSQSNSIKIIDFGVSKFLFNRKKSTKQSMWTVTGTIHFKAPQMFQGGQYNQLVDVWAIGVITYQMLYKKLPFDSQYTGGIIQKIMEMDPQYEQLDIAEESLVVDFIKALLKKNPKNRMSCKQALRHPWIQNSNMNVNKYKKFLSEDITNDSLYFHLSKKSSNMMGDYSPLSNSHQRKQINLNNLKCNKNEDIIQIRKQINGKLWVGQDLKKSVALPKSTSQFELIQQQKDETDLQIFLNLQKKLSFQTVN